MGDFNIDLLKVETVKNVSNFFNYLFSIFFAPYIIQPSRPISKTLIDNIFLNTIDYNSFSGNLTIQLSDHLFQFAILEAFIKNLLKILMKMNFLKILRILIGMKSYFLIIMIQMFPLKFYIAE